MAKPTGFLDYQRIDPVKRGVKDRIRDFREFEELLPRETLIQQAARCMDCGVPTCHAYGCPLKNRIPDWNDLIYHEHWRRGLDLLHQTNNFPEITGRICPAPCEMSCTLAINQEPVTIRHIELQIVEMGWEKGWIVPEKPSIKSGKKVAIIGSGPAGLAAAQQLARLGHEAVVFEKSNRIGGILRYGIPDYKMEKRIIDRRLEQMRIEGVIFETKVNAGVDISAHYLKRTFDGYLLATGATEPRNLELPGRDLNGIHFAMDFLTQQNRRIEGDRIRTNQQIDAKDKKVVVIGGGDTGSDCVGISRRQGAKEIVQVEILPEPPSERTPMNPWPTWPNTMRTSSSHEEGCKRIWSVMIKSFEGKDKHVQNLHGIKLKWLKPDKTGKQVFQEIPGSEFELKSDLVLLATGFLHVEHGKLIHDFNIKLDGRGNISVNANYMTSTPGVFAAGDCTTGASLVVNGIYHGRQAAEKIHDYLSRGP